MRLLHEHPTVKQFFSRLHIQTESRPSPKLEANWLRQLCFEAEADDGGFGKIDRPEGTASCKPM